MNTTGLAQRFLAMLAHSGYSLVDIEEGLLELQALPLSEAIKIVKVAQKNSGRGYMVGDSSLVEGSKPYGLENFTSHADLSEEIGYKVDVLLRREARIPTELASHLLTDALNRRFPNDIVPPFVQKKSFASWVAKLCRIFPSREILFAATAIRNSMVHRGGTDWTLK